MKKFIYLMIVFFAGAACVGCMEFTQKDYELQESKYEKERKAQEEQNQDTLHIKW